MMKSGWQLLPKNPFFSRRVLFPFSILLLTVPLVFFFARPSSVGTVEESFRFNRFGTVRLYSDTPRPAAMILLVSGDQGWNQKMVDRARALTTLSAVVVGIDLPHYLTALGAAQETCSYPGGDFDALSKFVQQKLGFPAYRHPVLVGFDAGATFVYATLAQAPPDMFQGAISLGFCPELLVKKPLCEWNSLRWQSQTQGTHFNLLPGTTLYAPWITLHGEQDSVCSAAPIEAFIKQTNRGTFLLVPHSGHDFSSPDVWFPQFKQVFARLVETASTPQTNALADLPLIEVPATGPATRILAVIISGDGGWATIDRDLGNILASRGVSVVGLNSLKYFWTRRTPEGAAKDLERILRYYLAAWKKDTVLLIGYSRGADVLPFMANRLPREFLSRTPVVALLGPSTAVDFEFHLTDWLSNAASTTALPVLPEVQKLTATKILCVYGEEEANTLCKNLDPQLVTIIRLKGGHHFEGDYGVLAERILQETKELAQK